MENEKLVYSFFMTFMVFFSGSIFTLKHLCSDTDAVLAQDVRILP